MSRPDEQTLQQVLATDRICTWSNELVPVFFDREAKERILNAVRAGLPLLASNLDADGLRWLTGAVLQELCRRASREAQPPAESEAPAATVLSGPDLSRLILGRYPHSVAVAYRELLHAASPAAEFGCLLTLFEATVHYLASVAVSAYWRTDLGNAECNRHVLGILLRDKWTTGILYSLFRDTVRLAGDCDGQLPYPELVPFLFRKNGKPAPAGAVLESFLELRNEEWGHGGNRSDDYFSPLVEANRPRLEDVLARMACLAGWHLVRPVLIQDGRLTHADLLNGADRFKKQPFELPLEPADLDPQAGDVRADRETLLLVAPDRDRYLPLFPLTQFRVATQNAYFLHGVDWSSNRPALALRKAVYLAYHARKQEEARHQEQPREFAATCLERHVSRLLAKVPAEVVPAAVAVPEDDPDVTLPEVRAEQQSHLRSFVGREELLAELAEWIDRKAEGGYLLLLGPPGQGKSALMAALAEREDRRGGCLLHMVKSHPQPLRFVPALMRRAAELAQVRFGADAYRGDLDDLRNSLVRAVEAVRDRTNRAVVLLDALDELETTGGRITFLPPRLPEGVRVVLTCRPDIPLVNALRARLHGNLEEREVPPLSAAGFRQLLEQRLPAQAVRALEGRVSPDDLFRRMQGNPLFLRCAVDDLAARWAEAERTGQAFTTDLDRLPVTLNAVMRDIYDRIRGRRDGGPMSPEAQQRARLLQLLCVAREPLGLESLCGLMATWDEPLLLDECRDRVEEMSQWLLEPGPGQFKPWHQGLTDHVRTTVLGEAGVRQVEELFCRWLEQPEAAGTGYSLRHRVRYLLAAGRARDAAELLIDLPELEARVVAGLVFDLANDFGAVAQALPEGSERQRLELLREGLLRDVHFIHRHREDYPQALFQCLWNTCWWYDSLEAAQYYKEGRGPGHEPDTWLSWLLPRRRRKAGQLSKLLEVWRTRKERVTPEFVWLRSLRPPAVHLGIGLKVILHGHTQCVHDVAFAPDGRRLASGSEDKTVRVWDAATGEQLLCLRGHNDPVHSVAFAPDGRWLASGSWDATARVWDAATGAELFCLRHNGLVHCVAFAPDGRRFASVDSLSFGVDSLSLGGVRIWNAATGEQLLCLQAPKVTCMAFAPDGRRLVSGSKDGTVRVWDAATGAELHCLRVPELEGSIRVAFSPDGRRLASDSLDGTLRIWDAATGEQLLCLQAPAVASMAFAPDGRRLASASEDGTVHVWDAATGAKSLCPDGHEVVMAHLASAPDGRRLASGSYDGTVHVWDAVTGEQLLCLPGHEKDVRCVAFTPDGRRLASASWDATVRVWDAATGAELLRLCGHKGEVTSVAFAPDGQRLASGSLDGTLRIWDAATGEQLLCLQAPALTSMAFAPDGRRLASGLLSQNIVVVWDAATGEPLLCLPGHKNEVTCVAFTPDGRRLVSGSYDKTVRVWDTATGACLKTIQGEADAFAIAVGLLLFPWRAIWRDLETVVESATTGQAVAWCSQQFSGTLPSGVMWYGRGPNYPSLFTLEGNPLATTAAAALRR